MGLSRDVKPGIVVFLISMVGVILAIAENIMYEQGILLDVIVRGSVTLPVVQIGTIIIFILLGIVVGVATS